MRTIVILLVTCVMFVSLRVSANEPGEPQSSPPVTTTGNSDAVIASENTAIEESGKKQRGSKTIKLVVPEGLLPEQQLLFRTCVDELNVSRKATGEAELEIVSKGKKVGQAFGRAAGGALATIAIAVTPLGGAAGLGRVVGDRAVARDHAAQNQVMQCMSQHQAQQAQQEAMENMLRMQQQAPPAVEK